MSARGRPWIAAVRVALVAALLAGTAAALWLAGPLSWPSYVAVGLAGAAAAGVILAAGRVSPLGPVCCYDAVRAARRGRHLVFRCLILAALLVLLLVAYLQEFLSLDGLLAPAALPPDRMARFARHFFEVLTAVQL